MRPVFLLMNLALGNKYLVHRSLRRLTQTEEHWQATPAAKAASKLKRPQVYMKSMQRIIPDSSRAMRRPHTVGTALSLILLIMSPGAVLAAKRRPVVSSRKAAAARPHFMQGNREQITQAQADLYERWRANINLNQGIAFEAGREYLEKYPNNEYAAHVRKWVAAYEMAARKLQFEQLLYKEKRYAAAFPLGKQILATEPDNIRTIISLASQAIWLPAARAMNHSARRRLNLRAAPSRCLNGAASPTTGSLSRANPMLSLTSISSPVNCS
jgi:hypothetical protein